MAGDYFHWQTVHERKIVDFDKTVLTTNATLVSAKSPNHFLVIQKIVYTVGIYAADAITFTDSVTGQQIVLFNVPAVAATTPGLQGYTADWGLTGTALALGANLVMSNGGASIGRIHVEAYQKLGSAITFVEGINHSGVPAGVLQTPGNQV